MPRDYPDSFVPEPVDRVAGRVLSRGYHHEFAKLRNNREALQAKHGCRSVKFQVYVKDGRAALKASPVR